MAEEVHEDEQIGRDLHVSFNRWRLIKYRVPISVIYDRCKAGESIRTIARDYEIPERSVRAAIRMCKRFGRVDA
jgi:hypothetical protein